MLAVEVSRHALVRVLMALPGAGRRAVRVLGIDDFSLSKGQAYATLLVDMETGQPVDVLPDREAATAEEWLRAHPEVEVICRDRAGAYAEAARAAPRTRSRWPTAGTCGTTCASTPARPSPATGTASAAAAPARPGRKTRTSEQEQEQEQERKAGGVHARLAAVVRERHAAVHELRAAGQTLDEAAAALGLSQQLTGRFWRAASADALLKARRLGLDPYKPYLRRRWDEGTTNIAVLHREITALGYPGSELTTWKWLALLKLAAPPKPPAPPGHRQITSWMLTDPARLDADQQAQLTAALARCPELHALAGHVTEFAKMLTGRPGDRLGSLRLARRRRRSPGRPSPPSPTASAGTTRPSATP